MEEAGVIPRNKQLEEEAGCEPCCSYGHRRNSGAVELASEKSQSLYFYEREGWGNTWGIEGISPHIPR